MRLGDQDKRCCHGNVSDKEWIVSVIVQLPYSHSLSEAKLDMWQDMHPEFLFPAKQNHHTPIVIWYMYECIHPHGYRSTCTIVLWLNNSFGYIWNTHFCLCVINDNYLQTYKSKCIKLNKVLIFAIYLFFLFLDYRTSWDKTELKNWQLCQRPIYCAWLLEINRWKKLINYL